MAHTIDEAFEMKQAKENTITLKPSLSLLAAAGLLTLSAGCGSSGSQTLITEPVNVSQTRVAMRDGVELHTEILLPAPVDNNPLPTLLLRTPYDLPTVPIGGLSTLDDGEDDDPEATRAAWQPVLDRGYAVVFQNLRGTQASGGRNRLFGNEREDGVDTIEWIRQQSWSNGRVGAIGDSAAGFSVHLLAAEQPPGLQATFSQASCGDLWDSAIWPEQRGLKLESFLAFMLGQSLEVGDEHLASLGLDAAEIENAQTEVNKALGALFGDEPAEQFAALTLQPFIDYPGVSSLLPRWSEVLDENRRTELSGYYDTRGSSKVPGMHVTLWQDIFVECALQDFNSLNNGETEQRLLVLDGSHYEIDDSSTWPYLPMLDWFDQHLKDLPANTTPSVQYTVQSIATTSGPSLELFTAQNWPPANTAKQIWYAGVDAQLLKNQPQQDASFDILSDPASPQNTLGGRHLIIDSGVAAQPAIEDADSVQLFTTASFDTDIVIAGVVSLETSLVSDVPDADLHARLVEVTPDNQRVLIVAGSQRARYRNGSAMPSDLVTGEATPL